MAVTLNCAAMGSGNAASIKTLHKFTGHPDGADPVGPLINVGWMLYGTTKLGGKSRRGSVFKTDLATNTTAVIYSFRKQDDGHYPVAGLINVNGSLFGVTTKGGTSDCGTIFKIDPTTATETDVFDFDGEDGIFPYASLTKVGGTLYGTASEGGTGNAQGTVFKFDPTTGVLVVLHSFQGYADGILPYSKLIKVGGSLFGTTYGGGGAGGVCNAFGCGTIFKVDLSTGTEEIVYSFKGSNDSSFPTTGMIYLSGLLYGTSYGGGTNGNGTVFQFNPVTGAERVVYSFNGGADGEYPIAALTDVGDTLFGTTIGGGADNVGTIFQLNPETGAESVVDSFKGPDQREPYGALIKVGNHLYGTTSGQAAGKSRSKAGSVFKLKLQP